MEGGDDILYVQHFSYYLSGIDMQQLRREYL